MDLFDGIDFEISSSQVNPTKKELISCPGIDVKCNFKLTNRVFRFSESSAEVELASFK